jgi:hypothetical protein
MRILSTLSQHRYRVAVTGITQPFGFAAIAIMMLRKVGAGAGGGGTH